MGRIKTRSGDGPAAEVQTRLGCGIGSERPVEGLVSESDRLRQGAGGHPGGDRRRVLMLLTLLEVREVLQRARRAPLGEWLQRRGRLSRQGHPFEKGRCDLAPRGLLTWLLEPSRGRGRAGVRFWLGSGGAEGSGGRGRGPELPMRSARHRVGQQVRWNDA